MINFDQMVKNIPQGYLIFGLIMSIFSLILCLINIGLLLVLSKMRFQTNVQVLASVYQAVIFIYFITQYIIKPKPTECQLFGLIEIVAFGGYYLYTLAFSLLVLMRLRLVNLIHKEFISQTFFHIFVHVLIGIVTWLAFHYGVTGPNIVNLCGIISSDFNKMYFVMLYVFFMFVSLYAYKVVDNYNYSGQDNQKFTKNFLQYQQLYMIITWIIWAIYFLSGLIAEMFTNSHPFVSYAFLLIQAQALFMLPLFILYLRLRKQNTRKKILRIIQTNFGYEIQENENELLGLPVNRGKSLSDLSPENILFNFTVRVKKGLILSLLGGVSIFYKEKIGKIEKEEKYLNLDVLSNNVSINDFNEVCEFSIMDRKQSIMTLYQQQHYMLTSGQTDEDIILKLKYDFDFELLKETEQFSLSLDKMNIELDGVNPEILNFEFFECRITAYCPTIFANIQTQESYLNVYQAFKILNNEQNILMFSQPSGGKSGEFFFFSQNNQLLIKTISEVEKQALLSRMGQYYLHLKENNDSLISKIVGIFTFKRESRNTCQTYNLIVMKQVAPVPRQYIMMTYDLKGSSFDRQVLKQKDHVQYETLYKQTLKDLDFNKIEKTVKVSQQNTISIIDILILDIEFFKSVDLMDYSLLIIKVDLFTYAQDKNITLQEAENLFCCYASDQEIGIYYAFGIIDYLQEWNTKKGIEKNWKQIRSFNSNLDTSAQNPKFYAERFKVFLNRIFHIQ